MPTAVLTQWRAILQKLITALLLVSIMVLCAVVQPATTSAAGDPFNVSGSLFYADIPTEGGLSYVNVYVQNMQTYPQVITVEPWINYLYPDTEATGGWINPDWVQSIQPAAADLQPGQSIMFSVCYSVPADAPELVYKTWLKVSNGATVDKSSPSWIDLEKPVTVWVRKGAAVPRYAFALASGGAYHLSLTGYAATASVDDPTDKKVPPIGIRSKCATPMKIQAILEQPGSDDEITQERIDDPASTLFYGKQEQLGNVYKAVDVETASRWVTIGTADNPCTLGSPLIVPPYKTVYVPWRIDVPDDVPDGCYRIWVHVTPAEPTGQFAVVDYISQLYIQVDREHSQATWWWFGGIIAIGFGLAVLSGLFLVRLVQELRERHRLAQRQKVPVRSRRRKATA